MKKKQKFDKLDKLIKAEQERQARKIEKGLSQDGSFDPDKIDSEALYQRIQEGIQKNREQKKMELEKAMIRRRERLRWMEKAACFFILMIVAGFCATMTSEANRTYLNDKIQYLTGNEIAVRVGNHEDQENMENVSEEERTLALQEIQEKLGIPVPAFSYEPEGKRGVEYKVIHENAIATIDYQYDDVVISFCVVNKYRAEVSGMSIDGKVIEEVEILQGVINIPVQKIENPGDEKPTYTAQWEYKGGYYQLSGKVEKEVFLKMVRGIYY